jgi:hypothetical protein
VETVIEFSNSEDRQGNSRKKLDRAGRFRLTPQNLNMTKVMRTQANEGNDDVKKNYQCKRKLTINTVMGQK